MAASTRKRLPPLLKLALEMGPLVLFFAANARPQLFSGWLTGVAASDTSAAIFTATAVFMVATVIALGAGYALTRHLPVMPLVSGIVVLAFGGLTLWLRDETFIKMKPTIINGLFGLLLLGGLALGRPLVSLVLDSVFDLTETGWRKLTFRWGLFFLVLAVLNEIVWRNFSTEFWISFKLFGTMPLTLLFAASQVPLLLRYENKPQPVEAASRIAQREAQNDAAL